jgi:hypothetical protein
MRMNSCAARQPSSPSTVMSSIVARVDVADRALDEAGFFVNQRRRDGLQRVLANVVPQPQQILAVALDFRLRPLRAGGADDQAHPFGDVQFVMISFNRRRSAAEVILRDIPPPRGEFGISTENRPASERYVVSAAPFVPRSSFTT